MVEKVIKFNVNTTIKSIITFNEAGQLEFGPGEIVVTILAIIAVALGIWIIWLKLFKPKSKEKNDLDKSNNVLISKKEDKNSKIKNFFSKKKKIKLKENNIDDSKVINDKNNDETKNEKEEKAKKNPNSKKNKR